MRTALGIDIAKENIHLLECLILSLLDAEEDPRRHGNAEDTEHNERLPANVVDGGRRDVCDDKIEEPLRRGTHTDTIGAKPGWEDLG